MTLQTLQRVTPWETVRSPKTGESKSHYLTDLLSKGAIAELRLQQASGFNVAIW